jgi:hypothetical protein
MTVSASSATVGAVDGLRSASSATLGATDGYNNGASATELLNNVPSATVGANTPSAMVGVSPCSATVGAIVGFVVGSLMEIG